MSDVKIYVASKNNLFNSRSEQRRTSILKREEHEQVMLLVAKSDYDKLNFDLVMARGLVSITKKRLENAKKRIKKLKAVR